MNKSFSIYW